MRLFYWNYLICQRMHHKDPSSHIGNVIDISKMILLKPKILTIVLVKHAGKRTDRTLQNHGLNAISSRIYYHWKRTKTKSPKYDLIQRLL